MRSLGLSVALAVAAACGSGAGRGGGAPVTNHPVTEPKAARPRLTLEGAFAMMAADTELVFELDVARLRQSVLWDGIEPWLRAQGGETLTEIGRMCAFDPLHSLDTLLLGARGIGGGGLEMTLFVRGFPQDSTSECLERASAAARERGDERNVRVRGDRVVLVEGQADSLALHFVDAQTFVIASAAGAFSDEKKLDEALARRDGGGMTRAAALYEVVERVDTRATMWLALSGKATMLGALPYSVAAVRAELHTSSDPARAVVGAMVIEVGDTGNAASLAQMLAMGLDTLKGGPYDDIARAMTVTAERGDVVVDVRLELAQLERLAALFGPIFP